MKYIIFRDFEGEDAIKVRKAEIEDSHERDGMTYYKYFDKEYNLYNWTREDYVIAIVDC